MSSKRKYNDENSNGNGSISLKFLSERITDILVKIDDLTRGVSFANSSIIELKGGVDGMAKLVGKHECLLYGDPLNVDNQGFINTFNKFSTAIKTTLRDIQIFWGIIITVLMIISPFIPGIISKVLKI